MSPIASSSSCVRGNGAILFRRMPRECRPALLVVMGVGLARGLSGIPAGGASVSQLLIEREGGRDVDRGDGFVGDDDECEDGMTRG